MKCVTIHGHLEAAACGRHQLQGTDLLFELQYLLRQTDGMWLVVSDRAIFDDDLGLHELDENRKRGTRRRQADCLPKKWKARRANAPGLVGGNGNPLGSELPESYWLGARAAAKAPPACFGTSTPFPPLFGKRIPSFTGR